MSDIVQRLRRKTVAGQPVFPTPLDIEAANEIERLRARVGRDVGDFDYPPGSAPCMCFFSTAEDRGPDPLGECGYHKALRARLAECERLLRESLDLVPRISDDDAMVPALAHWCRQVRNAAPGDGT